MKFEGPPQSQRSMPDKLRPPEQSNSEHLVGQLEKELEVLQGEEKITDQELPSLFNRLNQKLLAEVGHLSDDERLRHLHERKNELFASILKMVKKEVGDCGNFEVLEGATKIMTTDGRFSYGDDPDRPYFDTKTKKIYMGPEAMRMLTNTDVLIALLAAKGSSGAANDLHHEYIHSQQIKKTLTGRERLLEALNIFGDKNILIKEVHALIGADRKGNGKRTDTNELLKELNSDSYGLISTEEDVRRLEAAALAIKRLYAMGLSDEEVGALISEAKWDRNKRTYDSLTSEIAGIMQNRGLSDEEVNNLVKIDEIRTKLRIEKIRVITKTIIKDFLKE